MAKLLKNLPSGTKVKDTLTTYNGKPIIFTVMEHNHAGDPDNSTALITEKIITLKCFDAIEAGNSDLNRKQYGNNRYLYSNLRQWLNSDKAAGEWYSAQHSADTSPTNANVWSTYNEYDQEKGFLANFSTQLKEQVVAVTKRTAKNTVADGGSYEDVVQKIFLLSNTEVGLTNENNIVEGSIYDYFKTASNRIAYPTAEAVSKSEYTNTSLSVSQPWWWWLRTPLEGVSCYVRNVNTDGLRDNNYAYTGYIGVRPACVVSSSILVSDAADTDGAYTIIWNAPPVIETDSENLGDKNAPFNLSYTITDAYNDEVTAKVSLDGEVLQTLDTVVLGQAYKVSVSGTKLNTLSVGEHTFTIWAQDSNGNETTKTVGFTKILSSIAISGVDTNIGNKWQPFSFTYQVNDSNSNAISITELVDDEEVRKIEVAPQHEDITFNLSGFDILDNEASHRMTIKAVNSEGAEAYRYIDFVKLYKELKFEIKTVETDAPAKKIMLNLDYRKTGNPDVKIEVTNSAYNAQPVWEDATEAFKNKSVYKFTNKEFDTERYGVSVRVTVTKNSSTERVYVYAIGYSFD
nr:DUF6273 domain-containing protein [uncultured Catonella sp.]